MKEREISALNELNDKEQKRQVDRIRSALEEACRPDPALDARAMELLGMTAEASGSNQLAPSGMVEHYGDIVPEMCRIKFVSALSSLLEKLGEHSAELISGVYRAW